MNPTSASRGSMPPEATFRAGEQVIWRHIPRGGYGFVCPVPATVVRVCRTRVTIDAALARGGVKRVAVRPASLVRTPAPRRQEDPP